MHYLVQKIGSNYRPLLSIGKNNQTLFNDKLAAQAFIRQNFLQAGNYLEQHYLLVFNESGELVQKHEGWDRRQIDWQKVL